MVDFSGGKSPMETTEQLPKLRKTVTKVLKEARLFENHTFDQFRSKDMDYVLQMEMTNHGSAGAAAGAGFITGFTLFVIPTAVTDNYRLSVTLYDHGGNALKSYKYEDAITTWLGIWLLPVVWKSPDSVALGVWENMIRTAVRDIVADGLLDRRMQAVTGERAGS